MTKTIYLLALLIMPISTHALTKEEMRCGAVNVYHEARSLTPDHWDRVFKVAVNRKKHPKKFGAKSSNLCDIVHSKQYTTHALRNTREKQKYQEIVEHLSKRNWLDAGDYLYFSSKRGKMRYRYKFSS